MKKIAAVGAIGLLASCLYAQGLSTGAQNKDSWEEINFEFNSSILSDGYPSLLRLAELLGQHRDYRVKVTGYTDHVGSDKYNDKLALSRAEAVKAFLVKYGAGDGQITTAGDGKRSPEVDNKTKEGRFMNRRVTLVATDGTGKVIGAGGMNDIMPPLQELLKKQEECCSQILKRLDRLDDILAALKDLKGENDRLQSQVNDLRDQHNKLRDQVANLPKPLNEQQTQTIARTEATSAATGALDEARKRNQKFALLGLNAGPAFGAGRTGGYNFSGRARYFSPFGGDGTRAVQAQGEYMYYPGRQEGQFDVGLVNRWNNIQAGAFASFKYLQLNQYQSGGSLGQAAFLVDWIFSRGRLGVFGTQGFKSYAVLNNVTLAPGAYLQTYARVVNQYGTNFLVGTWGDAYVQGNVGYLRRREGIGSDRPGANLKLVQPLNDRFALTMEAGLNETLLNTKDSGRLVFGVEFGNSIRPKEYGSIKTPVPMDVPRVRYEFGTRRIGTAPPVADAGPNQLGVPGGTVTLNGSGSYDPLGLALTYQWTQITGPGVPLSSPTSPTTTFTAASGQSYSFRLTVKNSDNLQASASTTVTTTAAVNAQVATFNANPATIQSGQSSTLNWTLNNATSATISPGVGAVDPRTGSVSVSPTQTTTYTLTANGASGSTTAQVTVTVTNQAGNPQIVRFEGSPLNIQPGQQSTLSWTTTGASAVSISGIGTVAPNGSTTVTPAQTTTYILTASTADGKSVTAPITITVTVGQIPQIVTFVATPSTIDPGTSTKLCWQISNATSISIAPGVGSNLNANDCATVSPTQTTTYTLTATNSAGQIQANATVNVGQVRILSFTSNPTFSPSSGTAVTLSWQTANATSVVIVGNDLSPQSNLPANGDINVYPLGNAIYTLTAYGPGGQTVSVTISVYVR